MSIFEKIQSMTQEEFVEAASLGLACLACGCDSKDGFEKARPLIDGISQMMKGDVTEVLTKTPCEEAVWELLEGMAGKK